jgi:hypothetical protein
MKIKLYFFLAFALQTLSNAAPSNYGYICVDTTDKTLQLWNGSAWRTQTTLPNASSILPIFAQQITFSGPTAARTVTFPDASFTVARTDAANIFTGVQTMTSPVFTTPVLGAATGTSIALTGDIATSGGGIGFTAGNGGAVTQATNKSTGVTLNERMGNITMNNAALAAAAIVSFTWTNSTVSAEDFVDCKHHATGTFGAYNINARAAAGSSVVTIRNNTAGSLSEAIILKCIVFDGVNN